MFGKIFLIVTRVLVGLSFFALFACSADKLRERSNFNNGWKFVLGNDENSWQPGFSDSGWRELNLPHDWSIEGNFDEKNPATVNGGALPGGIGWYRKSFTLNRKESDKIIYVDFDGVYRNSEVWINGHYLGRRPYGYSSFRYELTPYLHFGSEPNIIAVKVDNSVQPNSRWYSGSGIYRNVWLVATGKIAVNHWGTYITTPEVSAESALLNIKTEIRNKTGKKETIRVKESVFDNANTLVASVSSEDMVITDTLSSVTQQVKIKNPVLWSDKNPYLYRVLTDIEKGNVKIDSYETVTGIRFFSFDTDKGFLLNGERVKIRGVCDHHDLGCLGAAVNARAIERQLELLKEMGCNAIRTSHNPPAPELLDLCDRMGFIVMDEAFDMWKKKKTEFDYSLNWDQWHKTDLQDMVLRDRNHPSVFIWSIGNEIPEQRDSTGLPIAKELAAIVRNLDNTRPITSACDDPQPSNSIISSGVLDLVGYNYHEKSYTDFPKTFPGKKFIATETTSAIATRSSYDMPSDSVRRWPDGGAGPFKTGNADLSCSSYDNCSVPWGSTHEETWKIIKKYDYMSGLFIWTGFDYLGEPTPYPWPARSSYFGIFDLSGFPKDAYYLYQSEWTDKDVLHIFPHWNWAQGKMTDVWAYTSCDEVELFLNGRSLGTKQKTGDELHLVWKVPFEAGTLLAVGKKGGKEILTQEIKTSGAPARIILTPDRSTINADGSDLSFVRVTIADSNNIPVPYADNLVNFKVEGNASVAGVDNGNQVSMESFKADYRKAFHGMCLVVLRSGTKAGEVKLTASSSGLESALVSLNLK